MEKSGGEDTVPEVNKKRGAVAQLQTCLLALEQPPEGHGKR
jgi:hypothetical protein